VGIANPLFQLVDMLTFNTAMSNIGLAKVSDEYLGMLNFTTQKIVIIPVMLATGFSMALVPAITNYYTRNQNGALINAMDKTYQVLLFVTLPAVVGISLLSTDIYHLLYSESTMGSSILAFYAPVAILFAFFQVTAALLQGIDYQKWIVFSLLTGILVKLAINIPLIESFETKGAIMATAIGYFISILINIVVLKKALAYKSKMVIRRSILIIALTIIMAAFVIVAHKALVMMFGVAHSKFLALFYLVVCIPVAVVVYGFLSLRIGLAQKLLGEKITKIGRKFGL
jgi:O-antigen/teichoic acid export membrane protein